MKRFRIACQSPVDATQVFTDFACEGSAMVGLAVIPAGTTDHFWERHSGGDELLFCLEGEATFCATAPDGTYTDCDMASGDLLFLASGEAHRAVVHQSLRVLFVTPCAGNEAWTDDDRFQPRH